MKSILIVEDEPTILRVTKTYFEREGYNVFTATDGASAIKIFNETLIDLACIDIMIPRLDGFEVTKVIRSVSDIPIILLTALQGEDDILKGYSLHVDDYIVKPFNPKILLAKVKNLLLRTHKELDLKIDYRVGPLTFKFSSCELLIDNQKVDLTKTEFTLLAFMARNIDKVCSRELLLEEVWGMDVYVDNRIIDAYIKKLRKVLAPHKFIKTHFGIGYMFEINES